MKFIPRFLAATILASASAQTVLVKPYVQPGDGRTLEGADVKVIAWVTDQKPGNFIVEYAVKGAAMHQAVATRTQLDFAPAKIPGAPAAKPTPTPSPFAKATPAPATPVPATPAPKPPGFAEVPATLEDVKTEIIKEASPTLPERDQHYYTYSAKLSDLPFNTEVAWRVRLGPQVIRQSTFKTRATADKTIRFVAVGDMANGKDAQNAIAWQVSQFQPDFVVPLGDIVYSAGRVSQYMHHFWTTYNDVASPGPKTGAPLMATIPFYAVIGNHDADVAKLPDYPDAYGAFYFFHGPLNGPGLGPWNTPLGKDPKLAAYLREKAGASYPALNFYSFDYGPAHFTILDTNGYDTLSMPQWTKWIENDLKSTHQRWKFVCFHAPPFHTSPQHYTEQKIRLLAPIFEANGVDVVFSGHVHNYQRSKPLHFLPNPPVRDPKGRVNGDFQLDEAFDGDTNTRPDGVVYIVSGGGGATLYNAKDFSKTVESLKKDNPTNWVEFTAKYVADKNSFAIVELSPTELTLRAITLDGTEVDRCRITKPAGK
jgi:predicted phosphodiesterase